MSEIDFLLGALNYADSHNINYDSSHPNEAQRSFILPLSRYGIVIGSIKLNDNGEFYFEKAGKKGSTILH